MFIGQISNRKTLMTRERKFCWEILKRQGKKIRIGIGEEGEKKHKEKEIVEPCFNDSLFSISRIRTLMVLMLAFLLEVKAPFSLFLVLRGSCS